MVAEAKKWSKKADFWQICLGFQNVYVFHLKNIFIYVIINQLTTCNICNDKKRKIPITKEVYYGKKRSGYSGTY